MKIHLLSGFLGSGKTTAIEHACHQLLKKEMNIGVIMNDQGIRLVDRDLFKNLNIPNRQVLNGCFCCNYNDLDANIQSLITANKPDIIFAESVGSCTDIVATVLKPLLQFRKETQVTLSTFADVRLLKMLLKDDSALFDESVRYIYFKQLEEAGIIVVNKIDLISDELEEIKCFISEKYGDKIVLYQNSLDSESINQWMEILDNDSSNNTGSLQINYDIYGEGESKLAWYDQEIEIYSSQNNAVQEAMNIMEGIYKEICSHNYSIGHLKFLLNGETKISFTAISCEEMSDRIKSQKALSAILLINARVQTSPDNLSQLITNVLRAAELKFDCKIMVKSMASFQPGYPTPTHRM